MSTELDKRVAIDMVGFEYFKQCISNGATPEEAKREMLTEEACKIMNERVKKILEGSELESNLLTFEEFESGFENLKHLEGEINTMIQKQNFI
ncbi:hypothetical protein [Tenacibaculum phage Larrie]|nr:hypothetical protein [Tenacibaculum phage Larrie]